MVSLLLLIANAAEAKLFSDIYTTIQSTSNTNTASSTNSYIYNSSYCNSNGVANSKTINVLEVLDKVLTTDDIHTILSTTTNSSVTVADSSRSIADKPKAVAINGCSMNSISYALLLQQCLSNSSEVQFLSLTDGSLEGMTLHRMLPTLGNRWLTALDLSFSSFDQRTIKVLASMLYQFPQLQLLALDGNPLLETDAKALAMGLRRHPSVRMLSLSSCSLMDISVGSIGTLLSSNPNITRLDLSMNELSGEGIEEMLLSFRTGPVCQLQHLDLSYNPIGELGIQSLAKAIQTKRLPNLKSLLLKEVREVK